MNRIVASKTPVTGDIPPSRFGHTFTMVSKDKAVLFGGAVSISGTLNLYKRKICHHKRNLSLWFQSNEMEKTKFQARLCTLRKSSPRCSDGFRNANDYLWRCSFRKSRPFERLALHTGSQKIVIFDQTVDLFGKSLKYQTKIAVQVRDMGILWFSVNPIWWYLGETQVTKPRMMYGSSISLKDRLVGIVMSFQETLLNHAHECIIQQLYAKKVLLWEWW